MDFIFIRSRNYPDKHIPKSFIVSAGRGYPPYGLLSLKKYIKRFNFDSMILDRYDQKYWDYSIKEFVEKVLSYMPRFIGISAMTSETNEALNIAYEIRKRKPDSKIIFGGAHFSALPEEGLQIADTVVLGEGEKAVLKICQNNIDLKQNRIISGEPLDNLDGVPYPTISDLKETGFDSGMKPFYGLMTSRGCPYNCYFCKDGFRGSKVRFNSVEYICNYLQHICESYGKKRFFILDDIFIPNESRLQKFVDEFQKRKFDFKFICFLHPRMVIPRLLPLYKQIGIEEVQLGVESGSDEILKYSGKGINVEDVHNAVINLKECGFNVTGLFIIGHKGETKSTLNATLKLAKNLPFDNVWFSYLCPFPGTPIWHEINKHGRLTEPDTKKWNNMELVFIPKGLSKFYLVTSMIKGHIIRIKKNFQGKNKLSLTNIKYFIDFIRSNLWELRYFLKI